jgi:toxin ParE1/3/4
MKPVIPRDLARRDLEDAVDYYVREAGTAVALRFVDSVESAYSVIARQPAAGSPRYAYELDLPGLRCWSVKRFPYLIFYVERDSHIDIWRVLHARRDIPVWMQEPDND